MAITPNTKLLAPLSFTVDEAEQTLYNLDETLKGYDEVLACSDATSDPSIIAQLTFVRDNTQKLRDKLHQGLMNVGVQPDYILN